MNKLIHWFCKFLDQALCDHTKIMVDGKNYRCWRCGHIKGKIEVKDTKGKKKNIVYKWRK